MTFVTYDRVADDYAAHREIHGGVFEDLCQRGGVGPHAAVLEVGCGTGNYIRVLIELARYSRVNQLEMWMMAAGLWEPETVTVEEPYEITSDGPFRDRAYSSLHLISGEAWRAGLERLQRDLARGPVRGVARYACVWGRTV
jgi:hypothetical protein